MLDAAQLLAVVGGGESTTRLDAGPIHLQHATSDYEACVAAMHRAAARRFPDTSVWPFVPDTNAAARARAEALYIGHDCGRPSQSRPQPRRSV